jgi:hypothetical protein
MDNGLCRKVMRIVLFKDNYAHLILRCRVCNIFYKIYSEMAVELSALTAARAAFTLRKISGTHLY